MESMEGLAMREPRLLGVELAVVAVVEVQALTERRRLPPQEGRKQEQVLVAKVRVPPQCPSHSFHYRLFCLSTGDGDQV